MKNLITGKNIRLSNYDYSENGYYFVTVCSSNRQNIFSDYKIPVGAGLVSARDNSFQPLCFHTYLRWVKMKFSTFFAKQARKPEGLFGRVVMRMVFDKGNAFLNGLVNDLMSVQTDDRILEIGSGTGKLIEKMAVKIDSGFIQGIDFSSEMVFIARKRNKRNITKGKVKIVEGNFDEMPYEKDSFTKACSVNTLYFWPSPANTAKKLAEILKPDGKLVLAFEDIEQLKRRNLSQDVFHLYSKNEVQDFLIKAGFSGNVNTISRKKDNLIFHCVVAVK